MAQVYMGPYLIKGHLDVCAIIYSYNKNVEVQDLVLEWIKIVELFSQCKDPW